MVPWKSARGYSSGIEVRILVAGSNPTWRDRNSSPRETVHLLPVVLVVVVVLVVSTKTTAPER